MHAELHRLGSGLLIACAAAACSPDQGACHQTVASGTYVPIVRDPSVPDKTLQVERTTGVVTIAYVKDGKQVIEHWRIAQ